MRKTANLVASATALVMLAGGSALFAGNAAAASHGAMIKLGKSVAYNRKTGNCLACHAMDDGVSPGDIGPPLAAMKARFPDKAKLRRQIADPEANNPNTRMPPFGKHKILSDKEIDAIVEYLYTL